MENIVVFLVLVVAYGIYLNTLTLILFYKVFKQNSITQESDIDLETKINTSKTNIFIHLMRVPAYIFLFNFSSINNTMFEVELLFQVLSILGLLTEMIVIYLTRKPKDQ